MTVSPTRALASASFSHAPASSSRGFFATDGTGTWNTARGRFFLSWYSQELVQHGERVLEHADESLPTRMPRFGIKCAGVHRGTIIPVERRSVRLDITTPCRRR